MPDGQAPTLAPPTLAARQAPAPVAGRAAAPTAAPQSLALPRPADLPLTAPLLLDARAAARLCGVGRSLWLQLASSGRCPAPIRLGRRTLWRAGELAAWTAAGCPGRDRWQAMTAGRGRP